MARVKKHKASWKDQIHTLEQRREAVDELVTTYQNEVDENLCRMLSELKAEKERLEVELQRISERREAIGQVLDVRWDAKGINSIEVDGEEYSRDFKLYVSTGDKAAYFQWLRQNEMSVLIQETVAAKTTESLVRERLESGKSVDGMGLNVHFKSVVK